MEDSPLHQSQEGTSPYGTSGVAAGQAWLAETGSSNRRPTEGSTADTSPHSACLSTVSAGEVPEPGAKPGATGIDVEMSRETPPAVAGAASGRDEQAAADEEPPLPWYKGFIGTLIVHAVGALIILAGSQGSCDAWTPSSGMPAFAVSGIYSFVVQYVAFIPAWFLHTEKFYDLVGGFTHITTMILAVILSWHTIDYRGFAAAVCVTIWATRLAVYLFMRLHGEGLSDGRFDKIKFNFWQFFMTWSLQGLWVTINTTAALALVTTERSVQESFAAVPSSGDANGKKDIDVLAVIGIGIWLFGWLYEVVADEQKRHFRKDPANKGKWIHSGLWRYSRHPNYFGEITLWTGLAIASVTILFDYRWVMLISPFFCCFLLTCVSGIPMLTERGKKKWGNDPEFMEYLTTTPALIPGPPRCC